LRSEVYDVSAEMALQKELFGRSVVTDVYDHPPFETLIYWALAYLPFPLAYFLWDLLNLILLMCSLYLLKPYATHFDTKARVTLALAALFPLISTLREGQNQVLLLIACVGAFVFLKKRREFTAGSLLGAGLIRFQFVVPLLLVFLALKRWKIILGAAAMGAFFGLISLATVGLGGIRDYIRVVLPLAKSGAFPTLVPAMPSVRGFVNVLLAGKVDPLYQTVLVAASSLALLAWPILKWRRQGWNPGSRVFDLLFSLSLVACLMINPHSLINGLLILILPGLLLLDYSAGAYARSPERWRAMLPLILVFLLTVFLNVAAGNRLSFLFVPILWLAIAISREASLAREQAGGGERGRS